MYRFRKQLLATAAVVALGGTTAHAADMAIRGATVPAVPYAQWEGAYIGGHVGIVSQDASCSTTQYAFDASCGALHESQVIRTTGMLAGLQAGWDWQDRYFVYGIAADWSWTNLKHTLSSDQGSFAFNAKTDWLASFRGRMGLALDSTMVYITGGVALADIQNSNSATGNTYNQMSGTQVGWVAGLGVEHKFNPHWSAFAEMLYYDFGTTSLTSRPSVAGEQIGTDYTNAFMTGRVGLNYRF